MYDNTIEKFPGSPENQPERSIPTEQDFAKSFEQDVPPFAGEQFGVAHENNDYYGETTDDDAEANEYDDGLSNAASLVNYGIDAIAREKGVEAVVQGIKSFDASGSDNPLRDLYDHLGVNTVEELDDTRDESQATRAARESFRNEYNMPKSRQKSREGAIKAIQDMKELISEVEGADPRYEELRSAAKASGKGYFEYAVSDFGTRGLTDLFSVLAEQKEQKEQEEQKDQETRDQEESPNEQSDQPNQSPEPLDQQETLIEGIVTKPEDEGELKSLDLREMKDKLVKEKDPNINSGQ